MEHYLIDVRFYDQRFLNSNAKKYSYKVPKDVHLDVGDDVVVYVAANVDQKHHIVRVVAIDFDARDHDFKLKWIVQKVDSVMWDELLAKEKEFKALVNKLLNRKKNKSLIEQLAEVASEDELEALKKFL